MVDEATGARLAGVDGEPSAENPVGNLDALKKCIEATRPPYEQALAKCKKLQKHEDRLVCGNAANTALMAAEGVCYQSFRGG